MSKKTYSQNYKNEESKKNASSHNAINGGNEAPYVKISKVISRILESDEKVIFAVSATRGVKLWEAIVTTCYAYTLKKVLLIFTDRRLIEVSIGAASLFASRIRVVSYSSIKDISCTSGFFRNVSIRCRDGFACSYESIKNGDMEEISGNLRNMILSRPRSVSNGALKNAADLCPSCFKKLNILTYKCAFCGRKFRDEKHFVFYSLLIPGGAYMMAGFHFAAVASFVAEMLFLAGIFSYVPSIVEGKIEFLPVAVFYIIFFSLSKYFSLKFCLKQIRSFIPSGQE